MFKDNGVAKAYSYDASKNSWTELGEVLNAPQAAQETGQGAGTEHYDGDQLFEAGEYDKILNVELGDGIMRKLPVNNGANYLEAADKFCVREGLSRTYVEQIIAFLRQNTLPYATRDLDAQKKDAEAAKNGGKPKCSKIPMTSQIFYD